MTLDIASLEASFELFASRGDELVKEFHSRLFEVTPSARAVFPVVGMVLIESMAVVAGEEWTGEYEQAWGDALQVIAGSAA
jgi:hemoglobin-like flavoprotein